VAKQEIQKHATILLCPIHIAGMSYALLQFVKNFLKPVRVQTSAQNALQLHGHELEPNQPMNVFISNPERKKERTDQDANEREVYVAGLSKFTTQADLEKLFKTVCPYSSAFIPYATISYVTTSTGR
jgi:hypothetical protein